MPYLPKAIQIAMSNGGARPGIAGGLMINPRAPGVRAGLQLPGLMQARARAYGFRGGRGDPGLFGAIGKFVGGVGKAALGVVKGAVAATPLGSAIIGGINAMGNQRVGAPVSRTGITSGGGTWQPPIIMPPPTGDFTDQSMLPDISTLGGGGGGSTAVALCNTKGFHLNRKGYWKDDGPMLPGAHWVPAGSVCVKNKRLNPFNPRAASRAMRRLGSLYRAMKVLDKQMAKVARGAGARSHASRSGGSRCGCSARRSGGRK